MESDGRGMVGPAGRIIGRNEKGSGGSGWNEMLDIYRVFRVLPCCLRVLPLLRVVAGARYSWRPIGTFQK